MSQSTAALPTAVQFSMLTVRPSTRHSAVARACRRQHRDAALEPAVAF